MLQRVRVPIHRLLSLGVLLLWLAPSVGAASSVLHVALAHPEEHHHHTHHAPSKDADALADLLRTATHGHHHDLATPEHDHEVAFATPVPLPKPVVSKAVVLSAPLSSNGAEERFRREIPARRGPPQDLFTTHCSLLL